MKRNTKKKEEQFEDYDDNEQYKKQADLILKKLDQMRRIVKEEIVTSIMNNQ